MGLINRKVREPGEGFKGVGFRGGKRVARRLKRREERRAREDQKAQEKEDKLSLGGSQETQKKLIAGAAFNRARATRQTEESRRALKGELAHAQGDDEQRNAEYMASRADSIHDIATQRAGVEGLNLAARGGMDILGAAQQSNQLTGTTENVLAQRAAALSAAPSAQSLAEQAVAAQQANMRANTNFGQGQLARQAMGVAAGQGEGGALAAQQAIASLVNAGGNMAAQGNLAQAEAAANMRAAAAAQARNETLSTANQDATARMAAAEAERNNQMATAQLQAGMLTQGAQATQNALQGVTGSSQATQNTAASMAAQAQDERSKLATSLGQQSITTEGMRGDREGQLLTAGLAANQHEAQNEDRPLWKKALLPFGMFGS